MLQRRALRLGESRKVRNAVSYGIYDYVIAVHPSGKARYTASSDCYGVQ